MLDRIFDKRLQDKMGNPDFLDIRVRIELVIQPIFEPQFLDAQVIVHRLQFLGQRT